jgi:RNA polymerase sigma factor (sigma-70 family)
MQDTALSDSYREHERDLIRFLMRRLRCAFTARDLAQDIWLKLDGVDDAQAVRNPRAYLFRMAANLATDHLRIETRRAELRDEAHDLLYGDAEWRTPERDLIAREQIDRVQQAIAVLPPLTREIFRLNRFAHRTQREIAAQLGLSTTAIENHIAKALAALARARDGLPPEGRD